jgi:hypothetical protein
MGLIPFDIVTDLDLLAFDSRVLLDFGATSATLVEKRRAAVTGWLRGRLEQANLPPERHTLRRAPDSAYAYVGGGFVDQVAKFSGTTEWSVSSLLANPAADALYVGRKEPFRGLYVGMTDHVNANSLTLKVAYWGGDWRTLSMANSFVDGTQALEDVSLSRGGRLLWTLPEDWFARPVNEQVGYWVRLQVTSPVTPSTTVGQLVPLARSRLTDATANYALHLIYREGIGTARGDWKDKAKLFGETAENMILSALQFCRDEFDFDEDQVAEGAAEDKAPTQDPFTWERG